MVDYDEVDDWEESLTAVLRPLVAPALLREVANAAPEYVEDARDLLLSQPSRERIIDAAISWLSSTLLAGYHGSRLTDEEVASIHTDGVLPLKAEARRARLVRALSQHPRWQEVTYGSEFDQCVARDLLGEDGLHLLACDGKARVIRAAVPGTIALEASHPYFSVDDLRARGEVPNVVSQFLEAWGYRLAHADFQPRKLRVDCGMIFRSPLPADWVVDVDTWTPSTNTSSR